MTSGFTKMVSGALRTEQTNMSFCSINITFNVVFMYKIKFKHFLFPILPKVAPLMWLFSFCTSCNLAVPFPVDCSVKFQPFSNNKHNNFHFLSAYWCILLIHLDSVHFGNRLVINAWWQCFLWKVCRLSKSEIDFGVLFFRTCLVPMTTRFWESELAFES